MLNEASCNRLISIPDLDMQSSLNQIQREEAGIWRQRPMHGVGIRRGEIGVGKEAEGGTDQEAEEDQGEKERASRT